ncbi:virulent strain associated related, partial [Cystoisospora suis]
MSNLPPSSFGHHQYLPSGVPGSQPFEVGARVPVARIQQPVLVSGNTSHRSVPQTPSGLRPSSAVPRLDLSRAEAIQSHRVNLPGGVMQQLSTVVLPSNATTFVAGKPGAPLVAVGTDGRAATASRQVYGAGTFVSALRPDAWNVLPGTPGLGSTTLEGDRVLQLRPPTARGKGGGQQHGPAGGVADGTADVVQVPVSLAADALIDMSTTRSQKIADSCQCCVGPWGALFGPVRKPPPEDLRRRPVALTAAIPSAPNNVLHRTFFGQPTTTTQERYASVPQPTMRVEALRPSAQLSAADTKRPQNVAVGFVPLKSSQTAVGVTASKDQTQRQLLEKEAAEGERKEVRAFDMSRAQPEQRHIIAPQKVVDERRKEGQGKETERENKGAEKEPVGVHGSVVVGDKALHAVPVPPLAGGPFSSSLQQAARFLPPSGLAPMYSTVTGATGQIRNEASQVPQQQSMPEVAVASKGSLGKGFQQESYRSGQYSSRSIALMSQLEETREQYRRVQEQFRRENENLKDENSRLQETVTSIHGRVKNIIDELHTLKLTTSSCAAVILTLQFKSAGQTTSANAELAEACIAVLAQLTAESESASQGPSVSASEASRADSGVAQQIGPLGWSGSFTEEQLQQLFKLQKLGSGSTRGVGTKAEDERSSEDSSTHVSSVHPPSTLGSDLASRQPAGAELGKRSEKVKTETHPPAVKPSVSGSTVPKPREQPKPVAVKKCFGFGSSVARTAPLGPAVQPTRPGTQARDGDSKPTGTVGGTTKHGSMAERGPGEEKMPGVVMAAAPKIGPKGVSGATTADGLMKQGPVDGKGPGEAKAPGVDEAAEPKEAPSDVPEARAVDELVKQGSTEAKALGDAKAPGLAKAVDPVGGKAAGEAKSVVPKIAPKGVPEAKAVDDLVKQGSVDGKTPGLAKAVVPKIAPKGVPEAKAADGLAKQGSVDGKAA